LGRLTPVDVNPSLSVVIFYEHCYILAKAALEWN